MGEERWIEVVDGLVDLCNALEAAAVKLRRALEGFSRWTWDASKIKWVKAEGAKGPYERSEDVNNLEFKAMLKGLAAQGGRVMRDGWFYWVFSNGAVVGRKKKG